jgi:transcriptional regulator with XRE-family HTH domain
MTASGSDAFPTGQAVARNIRRLLEGKGMSLEDLARKTGYPMSLLDEIVSGNSKGLQLTVLQDIAVALGADAEELTENDPKDA